MIMALVSDRDRIVLAVETTWDGVPARPDEVATVELHSVPNHPDHLLVTVEAPFHDDPAPEEPAGLLDGLWSFEVVELFVAGADGSYVELEIGPQGHVLLLRLDGVRHRAEPPRSVEVDIEITGERWTATARLPRALLPPAPHRVNAHAIHGASPRRYLSHRPAPGPRPDFHQLDIMIPVTLPDRKHDRR